MGKLVTETPYSEVNATLEVFDRFGIERDDLTRFRKASSYVQMEVVRLMKHGEQKPATPDSESLTITVDYGLSLTEMIAQGRYDWTNRDITEECFPVKGIGKVERGVELIHLGYDISSDDALKELTKRGLRPATIEELLAFGAKYPDLQRKFPIVGLGSSAHVSGFRYVPYLHGSVARRVLNLDWYDHGWYDGDRFLAVRNK